MTTHSPNVHWMQTKLLAHQVVCFGCILHAWNDAASEPFRERQRGDSMFSCLELPPGRQRQLGEAQPMTQTSALAFKGCRGLGPM